jgi:NAD(P)H-dependent flavin oxidoreductase YrpB (nitropropane dioxygenase family)
MLEGDVERGCVSVSQAVGGIKEARSAKEIVDDIAEGIESLVAVAL